MKPRVVVYSAQEDLAVARAIQENIGETANVFVWTQGTFPPSQTTIDALEAIAALYDFAIFVLTPLDRLAIGKDTYLVPRDNVVFESGLFLGRLRRERVFFVSASKSNQNLEWPFRIFTDLHGLTRVGYDRSQPNLVAALSPACNKIETAIKLLGVVKQDVHIINKKSGKCLDVAAWSKAEGAQIIQYTFHASENQLWTLLRLDHGRFKIMSRNSRKFMDVAGQSKKDGELVHQWPSHDGASQEWQIERLSGGAFKIMCTHSQNYLAVEAGSMDNGAKVVQQAWREDDSFRWWVNAAPEILAIPDPRSVGGAQPLPPT